MSTNESASGLLLRAEIRSARESLVSYAKELTRESVFVVTDWRPPLQTDVRLRISFPSLVDPVEVSARVEAYRGAAGVGSPGGLQFSFRFASADERSALETVVERLAEGPDTTDPPRLYRVLLVEDNALIRDMFAFGIERYFTRHRGSVQVEYAPDALVAHRLLAEQSYDLVIVDHYLPAEDGATFIAKVRRDPRFATAPIVAISVGGSDARDATMSAGADLFLDKPLVLRDLFRTLQALTQRGALA